MKSNGITQYIHKVIQNNKRGIADGIFSVCSANRFVLEASIQKAKKENINLLIEATSNQVNQYGGYTGMTPIDFSNHVFAVADKYKFPKEKIIFGGDHLGPYPWRNKPTETALSCSDEMVRAYVAAGYKKIHIDASMYCHDDDRTKPLSKQLSAERAAHICKHAENTAFKTDDDKPLYVIGTEVPLPGGQQELNNQLNITTVDDVNETLDIFKKIFIYQGLESAWERVIAVVVQPGVEFAESEIIDYQREKAAQLTKYIGNVPGIVFEAHSTDYQTKSNLRKMVEDHFVILKVGPALTFNFREAVFALQKIEEQLFQNKKGIVCSNLIQVIKKAMNDNPDNWKNYYKQNVDIDTIKLFGFSDRIRYYWNVPEVEKSLNRLLSNLKTQIIPLSLISQFFPNQFTRIRNGELSSEPEQLIIDHISEVLGCYFYACNPGINKSSTSPFIN